jgi:hypothetical protein
MASPSIDCRLLDDRYPSTDEARSLRLDIPYPDARTDLNRWLPLAKWFLAIPHHIVLAFLGIAAVVCIVIAGFAILFTRAACSTSSSASGAGACACSPPRSS